MNIEEFKEKAREYGVSEEVLLDNERCLFFKQIYERILKNDTKIINNY